ncbi:MAG TPA: energy transducer TonB [Sphingomonas sp.]|jgi:TonB family protein
MNKVATALLVLPLCSAQTAAPPPGSPPPIITMPVMDGRAERHLVTWSAGPILCAGEPVSPTLAPSPLPSVGARFPGQRSDQVVRLSFAIGSDGRPIDIAEPTGFRTVDTPDLGPALAASRFAAGAPRTGCAIWFTPTRSDFASADPTELMGLTILPTGGRLPPDAWKRVEPASTTCSDPPPDVLVRAFPEFKKIPQAAGTFGWTMVGFDINAAGKPVRARRVAGTGNAVLDREAAAAVERSRFEAGARQGCLYPYWRRGENLVAPEPPTEASLRPAGATCPEKTEWERPPIYAFPDNFRRRHVEGWAVVGYDVAPWGEIGNPRVLAAQPAAVFGESAIRVLRGAAKKASPQGYTGCVDRVRFVVGPTPRPDADPNTVTPPDAS